MPKTVLFLCSGNYYRSRYAEAVFNHRAAAAWLDWVARSKGLVTEQGTDNVGPISAHTRAALATLGIPLAEPVRYPEQCGEADLIAADLIVGMKEAEHRGQLAAKHPAWPDRVRYWHVHDLDAATPAVALAQIERHVAALVEELRAGR